MHRALALILYTELEKETDKHTVDLGKLREELDQAQTRQAEGDRSVTRQQKATERYHAKREIMVTRKDECNRLIRDLGVLPEDAFDKYTNTSSDRVSELTNCEHMYNTHLDAAHEEASHSQRKPEEVCSREQESV
jgi:chromosome segregation ATPase